MMAITYDHEKPYGQIIGFHYYMQTKKKIDLDYEGKRQ